MTNSFFIKDLSNNLVSNNLYEFLEYYCINENNFYKINNEIFKQYILSNKLNNFIEFIKPYYLSSKKNYITRNITYNNFITILRHICKHLNIEYNKRIIYNKNNYHITYYIKKN
jgi:hypothetical protein